MLIKNVFLPRGEHDVKYNYQQSKNISHFCCVSRNDILSSHCPRPFCTPHNYIVPINLLKNITLPTLLQRLPDMKTNHNDPTKYSTCILNTKNTENRNTTHILMKTSKYLTFLNTVPLSGKVYFHLKRQPMKSK